MTVLVSDCSSVVRHSRVCVSRCNPAGRRCDQYTREVLQHWEQQAVLACCSVVRRQLPCHDLTRVGYVWHGLWWIVVCNIGWTDRHSKLCAGRAGWTQRWTDGVESGLVVWRKPQTPDRRITAYHNTICLNTHITVITLLSHNIISHISYHYPFVRLVAAAAVYQPRSTTSSVCARLLLSTLVIATLVILTTSTHFTSSCVTLINLHPNLLYNRPQLHSNLTTRSLCTFLRRRSCRPFARLLPMINRLLRLHQPQPTLVNDRDR